MIHSMDSGQSVSRRDILIAVALSALGVGLMVLNVVNEVGDVIVDAHPLAVPAFLAVTAPVAWRRKVPIAALVATLAALLAHAALFGELTRCGVVFPTTFVLVFAAAAWLELRPALGGLAIGLALVVALTLFDLAVDVSAAPMFGVLTAVFWGIGRVARSRGHMITALEAQTAELREARDERSRLEVATDRERMSTQLDALLQRRLSELARLADSPNGGDPAAATAKFVDIEHEGRRTLQEMRAIVGVLREDSDDAPTLPQPTLTHLEAMLLRAKGADAKLTVEGSPRLLPAGVELSAYRIVEHLLAALEDASGVEVRVRFGDEALELTVAGTGGRRASAALERARERARLHHGTLAATVRDGRTAA
ncbi:MAG: hypothetical protein M3417_09780, partial [Actinomycetota bacterium]|nr:hypothetical protein [Actinomycetota bacterium]